MSAAGRSRRTASRRRRLRRGDQPPVPSLGAKPDDDQPPDAQATDVDQRMMRRALRLARQAGQRGEVPIGAVLYRGDQVVAEAGNAREASGDPTAHAELLVLSQGGRALKTWRLSDCSLAVTLEPCAMCAGAMINARLGRVVYGCGDPKAGACESLYELLSDDRLNHRVTIVRAVLADQCAAVLRRFFQSRR